MAEVSKVPLKKLVSKLPMTKQDSTNILLPSDNEPLDLPDSPEKEEISLESFLILIYGKSGVGKSTLPSHAEKPFYFRFENSSRSLYIARTPVITNWGLAKRYLAGAERNLKGYKTFVIDTGSPAHERCLEWVCAEKLNIVHPGLQKDYGYSWHEVHREFMSFLSRIAALGVGIWVIAHEDHEEGEITPNVTGKALEFFKTSMDMIGYYFYSGTNRWLLIRGNDKVLAKCNIDGHFLTPVGKPVVCIPMGNSSSEAYRNFVAAFDNRQKEDFAELVERKEIAKLSPLKIVKKMS